MTNPNNIYNGTLGDTSSKGAWYVPNTRFNAQGQLVVGTPWQGTVDPFPTNYSANEFVTGNADPGGGPNLLAFQIALTLAQQPSNTVACSPTCSPVYPPAQYTCDPTTDLPLSVIPTLDPVMCQPPQSLCPPVVNCPPSMPAPAPACPSANCPPSGMTPYPPINYPPAMLPYPTMPSHPGNNSRQALFNQLLQAVRQLLTGNDQGLPLNQALPSPFGYSTMSPYQSPYRDLDPWSGQQSMTKNDFLKNWLSSVFNPNLINQTKTSTIYPPITGTTDLLNRTGVFPTLGSLLNRGGLTSTLTNLEKQGPLIVFAPTESAFNRLNQTNPALFQRLQDPRNVNILNEILKYHVSQASRNGFRFPAVNTPIDSLTSRDAIKYSGNAFQGNVMNGNQLVTTGRVLKLPNNTLIVPIDDVLIPPGLDLSCLQ